MDASRGESLLDDPERTERVGEVEIRRGRGWGADGPSPLSAMMRYVDG